YTGGCLCGAVRYKVTGEAVRVVNCQCNDCRKVTGAGFATNVFVKEEDLVIESGVTKPYQHKSDSRNMMTKKFCPECGSQIFSYGTGSPGVVGIKVGSIDDAHDIKPQITVYAARALPFSHIDKSTEIFQDMRRR
ncbi:MAG: GFA family protein, partial [Pseudomonadota bacterium]|nr:GFA family protein [Pseudomonadota bacterium]